ncbi:MAG TPA: hypothetical protein VH877_00410 [Polyangia bacterium]|jgi:hypothetical protein|nr:hypothetical protein [Polyangia bacterium]
MASALLLGALRAEGKRRSESVGSLSESAVQQEFVAGLLDALHRSEKETLKGRVKRIQAVLDRIAERLGMPEIPTAKGPPHRILLERREAASLGGLFRGGDWRITVDEKLLTRGPMSVEQIVRLADILGHELRHPEHRFRMACWLADSGRTSDIVLLTVPKHIINEALRPGRPRLDRKRAAEAKHWFSAWLLPERKKNAEELSQAYAAQARARLRQAELQRQLAQVGTPRSAIEGKELKALRKALGEATKEESRWSQEVGRIHQAGEKLPLERDCQRIGQEVARWVARLMGGR